MSHRLTCLTLALLLGACGGTFSAPLDNSPGAVVEVFYQAANEGRYSDAEQHLSTEALVAVKQIGFKRLCDMNTRNGQIKTVEIMKEDIRGEGATVHARILFNDGKTKDNDITELIREKGTWKVALGGR